MVHESGAGNPDPQLAAQVIYSDPYMWRFTYRVIVFAEDKQDVRYASLKSGKFTV